MLPRIAFLIIPLLAGGCSYEALHVERMQAQPTDGICYTLPKTVLAVTVVYAVERRTTVVFGKEIVEFGDTVKLNAVPAVVPVLVPDNANAFVIRTRDIGRNVFLETTQQYTIDDLGMLTSVGSEMNDQTVEVVKEFASAAVEFAKLAARGAEATPAERLQAQLQNQLTDIYMQIAEAGEASRSPSSPAGAHPAASPEKGSEKPEDKADTPSFRDERRSSLVRDALALRALIRTIQEDCQQKTDVYALPYCVLLDPKDFVPTGDGTLRCTIEPPQLFDNVRQEDMPKIVVQLVDAPSVPAASTESTFDGLVYRPARAILTQVLEDSTDRLLCTSYISYPQFSPLVMARIQSKPFTGTSTALTFSPTGGGLRSMNVKQGSSAQGAAAVAKEAGAAANEVDAAAEGKGAKKGGPASKSGGGAAKSGTSTGSHSGGGTTKSATAGSGSGGSATSKDSTGSAPASSGTPGP